MPGDTFIDIGANFGYFSLVASALVGDKGHVFSFEPEAYNYNALCNNININKFKNIKAYNIALGKEERDSLLYIDRRNDGGHTLWGIRDETFDVIGEYEPDKQVVKERTLDKIIYDENITSIKIIGPITQT